jgi:hypothetical protein
VRRSIRLRVDAPRPGDKSGIDQASLRITGLGMFDLDEVGAPVGEHGASGGNERPCGELDDANAAEHIGHALVYPIVLV